MDLPDKDPDPDTLKLSGYPIRPRPKDVVINGHVYGVPVYIYIYIKMLVTLL